MLCFKIDVKVWLRKKEAGVVLITWEYVISFNVSRKHFLRFEICIISRPLNLPINCCYWYFLTVICITALGFGTIQTTHGLNFLLNMHLSNNGIWWDLEFYTMMDMGFDFTIIYMQRIVLARYSVLFYFIFCLQCALKSKNTCVPSIPK